MISIHALREEGDPLDNGFVSAAELFLSTPSARRATGYKIITMQPSLLFLSTPSARRATSFWMLSYCCCKTISIHALREEGDQKLSTSHVRRILFLSTPSARRATQRRS